MASAVREGVVIVVPAFSKADDGDREIVGAVIPTVKWAAPKNVTDGVYAPRRMMHDKNAQ